MPTISEKRIFELVGSFYDHAREPSHEGWQSTYLEIANLFSSGPGGFLLRNEADDQFNFAAGNTSAEFLREYVDYYQFVSPFRGTLKGLRFGELLLRSNVMPDDEWVRTEFYNDYLRRIDTFNFAIHNLAKSGSVAASLVITRPKTRPDFTENETRAMAVLVPHLGRALEVYLNFADVRNENQAILAALASMPHGVIVVDKDRKVKFANQVAEVMFRKNDGLGVDRGGALRAVFGPDDRRLSVLLRGIFEPTIDNLAYHGGAHRISRPDGSRSLQIFVTPFSAHVFMGVGSETMAMIFIHDRGAPVKTNEAVLVQLYGLTAAEARLAAILAGGKSMDEACEILNIAQNTGRTHLKHIFAKTDTHRQSELVKLVINGLANLRMDQLQPPK